MNNYKISGKTQICAVIGDPIGHSMSPPMHNAAYKELGLDYIYLPLRVETEHLKQAVAGLRALNFRGFNVTIPHKVAILSLLDGLDELAEKIGAVNTVVSENGELKGYNTDGPGFLQALLERGIEPEGKNTVVLGAGGAARAIAYILARRGAPLTILNRKANLIKADAIARFIREDLKTPVKIMELVSEPLKTALNGAEILVNATSVGMIPEAEVSLVPAELLRGDLIVCDVVYNPLKTKLLSESEKAGCRTIGGVDMLAWQGALSFEQWTERKAPLELMRQEVFRMLQKGQA